MTITPSPADYLEAILNGLLPTGESASVSSRSVGISTTELTIVPSSSRAHAIILGKAGMTVTAIRRLMQVYGGSHRQILNVYVTERDSPNAVRSEVST